VRTDARNAGAKEWVDEAVVSDSANGYTLVTSRTPKDPEDFLGAVNKALVGS
jgi:protease I